MGWFSYGLVFLWAGLLMGWFFCWLFPPDRLSLIVRTVCDGFGTSLCM